MNKINIKPDLSIIIAHFESLRIKKVLKSFLSEKKINLEIILVDDNPFKTKKKYLPFIKDKRLKIIQNKKNIGPLNCFIHGIKVSRGKFILLSSDHDFYKQKSLYKIIKPLLKNNYYAASFCNFNEIDEKEKIIYNFKKRISSYFNYFYRAKSFVRAIIFYLDPEFMGKANMFYSIFRKKLFDVNKFKMFHKNFGLNADRIFLFDFIQKNKIYIHKEKLFNVIIHDKDFYKNRRKKRVSSIMYFYQQIKGYVFFSNTFVLKILIIIFSPYKLYQLFLRKFLH